MIEVYARIIMDDEFNLCAIELCQKNADGQLQSIEKALTGGEPMGANVKIRHLQFKREESKCQM